MLRLLLCRWLDQAAGILEKSETMRLASISANQRLDILIGEFGEFGEIEFVKKYFQICPLYSAAKIRTLRLHCTFGGLHAVHHRFLRLDKWVIYTNLHTTVGEDNEKT